MLNQTLNSRYTVTAYIGSGAMADVYQATDSQTNQTVAQLANEPGQEFRADQ